MRDIKFRAFFKYLKTKEMIMQVATVNHEIDTNGYIQITEWEQFTGLKDMNGLEIYEGDIITWEHLDNVNYIIKWDTEEAHYFADHVINKDDSAWIDNKVIVIGDVHNNPELLELQEQEGER